MDSAYPNIGSELRIFQTIPVSVPNNERAFSKLKIIKNVLRSSMGQELLTHVGILSIEREAVDEIDFDNIIDISAKQKCKAQII